MADRNARRAPLALAALLLAGCASTKQGSVDVQLLQLASLLPGHYDNTAQVEADRRAGRPPHQGVNVVIEQIDSLTVGDHAFYMQETAADDPQQVLGQHVFSLRPGKGGVIETVWALADPRRWRGGASQPELFAALQYPDLKLLMGCELLWKKDGDRFTAVNDMAHCHETPPQARGAVFARWDVELTSDTLALAERAYDPEGRLVAGRAEEPFLRLRRAP